MTPDDRRLRDLEGQVAILEHRLAEYHEWLEQSLAYNEEFQLGATWGVLRGAGGIGWVVIVIYAPSYLSKWLPGFPGWLYFVTAFCAATAASVAYAWHLEKGQKQDVGKLRRYPIWSELPRK